MENSMKKFQRLDRKMSKEQFQVGMGDKSSRWEEPEEQKQFNMTTGPFLW